jgi:hypothetical protein
MTRPPILSDRQLNRALLARQHLLGRTADLDARAMTTHLVGLQAQAPDAPYVALWSRVAAYDPSDLGDRVARLDMVRLTLMRGTIHLVTVEDALALQPLLAGVAGRTAGAATLMRQLGDRDLAALLADAERELAARPMSRGAVGAALAPRWPGIDPDALGYGATALLPTLQVPPRGVWRSRGAVAWAPLSAVPGHGESPPVTVADLVTRYLAAFGPATVEDVAKWSGLTGLRPVIERLRPHLATARASDGRELFDVPGAPLPDPATPAPPRFLPEYDNVLIAHADRGRVMTQAGLPTLPGGYGGATGTVLVDGMLAATWRSSVARGTVTLAIEPLVPIAAGDQVAVGEEGTRLVAFTHPGLPVADVTFAEPAARLDPRLVVRTRRRTPS